MDLLDTLIPASQARLRNAWDILDDMEACNFAIQNGGSLVCIVDADDWSRTLYDDGEFTKDRKFSYTPMFASVDAAQACILKLGPLFHAHVPTPKIVSVVQAAAARLATHEAKTHEWGE